MLIETLSGATTKTTTASICRTNILYQKNARREKTSNEVYAGVSPQLVFSLYSREVEGESDFAHWMNTRRGAPIFMWPRTWENRSRFDTLE
jgi:hypothetical protein